MGEILNKCITVQTLVSALAAAGFAVSSLVSPMAAQAANEVALQQTSGTVQVQRNLMVSSSAHSISISKKFWPTTSAEAVVVESTDSLAIAAAGPLARSKNVPLLLIDGTAPNPVKDDLRRLATSSVILVGAGFNPKTLLRQEINSVVPTQNWVSGAGPQEYDGVVASMFAGTTEEVFLTDATDTVDLVTASAASSFQRSPIFTVGTTLSLTDKGELQRLKPKRAFYVGSGTAASQIVAAIEALGIPVIPVEGATATVRNETVVKTLQAKNLDGRTLTVASQAAPNAALASSFGTAMDSGIPQFPASQTALSGTIREQAISWGLELKSATIVGPATGVTDTFKSQLQAAVATPRATAPSFHVVGTGTNADGSGWIELSALTGAAQIHAHRSSRHTGVQRSECASPHLGGRHHFQSRSIQLNRYQAGRERRARGHKPWRGRE
jgi:putative cell wall-binding protein